MADGNGSKFDIDGAKQAKFLDTSNNQPVNKSIETNILSELRKMNEQISALNGNMRGMSQTNAQNTVFGNTQTQFRDDYSSRFGQNNSGSDYVNTRSGENVKRPEGKKRGMDDSLQETLFKDFLGDSFKKSFQSNLSDKAADMFKGIKGKDISGVFKDNLSKQSADWFKGTDMGKSLLGPLNNLGDVAGKSAGEIVSAFGSGGLKGAASAAEAAIGPLSTAAGSAATAIGSAAVAAAPAAAALLALDYATEVLGHSFKLASDAFSRLGEGISNSANREEKSSKRNREEAQKRLVADVETLIKKPFEILEESAQRVYDAWDSNIRLINQTQGYTKSDLQLLMGGFAERARSEGLSKYVNAADITQNLAKVLQSGLSGKVAEEFAYQATILNAAIPFQDFFSFADTYASVAANLIKNGASQDEAIAAATSNLRTFASTVLSASRELSGGFSTGLKDAQGIYEKAVKIANAARISNPSQIAGVLTSAAAATGAIAPDLVSTITDTIYQVATGGNTDQVVALRSLYGAAENTEFLRQFANDPQGVMRTIFTNLAGMFNSSSGVYMTAAGPYAELFGMSSEAFQRLDFKYLADAIGSMSVNNEAINENMELLKSGQSTLTKEQLRAEQINTYMIEEGLAYVLDSEAGREIQRHMWDEQIAREQMEATYGVELTGAGLDFLQGISQAVKNILDLINPFGWIKKIAQVTHTINEASGLEKDIQQVLEITKVGGGNSRILSNLVTRNADLGLTPTLVELLGGTSAYAQASANRKQMVAAMNFLQMPLSALFSSKEGGVIGKESGGVASFGSSGSLNSMYNWGTLGKSAAAAVGSVLSGGSSGNLLPGIARTSGSKSAADAMAGKIEKMLADEYLVDKFVKQGKSYEEFAASAKQFGISDFNKALEEAGYNRGEVEGYFQSQETKQGGQMYEDIRQDEKDFRDAGRKFWREDFWTVYQEPFFQELTTIEENYLQKIIDNQIDWKEYFGESWNNDFVKGWMDTRWDKQFWKQFNDYFFEHKIYNGGTLKLSKLEKVQEKEKAEKGDLANALAEYLTRNNQNLEDLKDPTIQTNMLLSQILVVANAIMNQTARSEGTLSLADSLAAAAVGLTGGNNKE